MSEIRVLTPLDMLKARMAAVKPSITPFDPATYLDTDECRIAYLEEALKTEIIPTILDACVVIARSMSVETEASEMLTALTTEAEALQTRIEALHDRVAGQGGTASASEASPPPSDRPDDKCPCGASTVAECAWMPSRHCGAWQPTLNMSRPCACGQRTLRGCVDDPAEGCGAWKGEVNDE